jgi:hypothetical protein
MTLAQFYDQLKCFDWYYRMSDDNAVWRRGCQNKIRLATLAVMIEGGEELMSAFSAHYIVHGERAPLPERPAE